MRSLGGIGRESWVLCLREVIRRYRKGELGSVLA